MTAGLGGICAVIAALGCLYLLLAIACVLLWQPSSTQELSAQPEPVSLLKPLHGNEPRLLECLSSFCRQHYPAPMQIILGLQDENDEALSTAKEISARFPGLQPLVAIDETQHGTNAKVSNLVNMEQAAAHNILIAADSDILVKPDHIGKTVALLQKRGAGAVSALYCGTPAAGFWSRLSAYCVNTHFLPNVVLALTLRLAKPCFGSTIAIRRSTLAAIGGFEAFANQLADDYAIGEAVRKTGQRVEIGPFLAVHVCAEANARELFLHQLRWARTVKAIDLPGYAGSIITYPFAIASLGALAGDGSCIAIAGVALCLRVVLCKLLERSFQLEKQDLWLAPAACWMLFGVHIWSFFGSAVIWKRAAYRVLPGGVLVQSSQG